VNRAAPPTHGRPASLCAQTHDALGCADVDGKLARVAALERAYAAGEVGRAAGEPPPEALPVPGRPERPVLVPPRALQRRTTASREGYAALLHSIAHIEFNAINLALDAVYRFRDLPEAYYRDWLSVAAEEAHHFRLLRDHLRTLGYDYGDFPAHDGLWEMAVRTAHDALARMALVPRVLEARGLDASPGIIRRLRAAGDMRAAGILEIILRDEVGHVAIGSRWFEYLCSARGLDPQPTFERLLAEYDAPRPVLPLNREARARAGFGADEIGLLESLARSRRESPKG